MNDDYTESLLKLAESLEGRLVTDKSQVSGSDVVVAFVFYHSSNPETRVIQAFAFSDQAKQNEFSKTALRAYEDTTLFAPWTLGEYL